MHQRAATPVVLEAHAMVGMAPIFWQIGMNNLAGTFGCLFIPPASARQRIAGDGNQTPVIIPAGDAGGMKTHPKTYQLDLFIAICKKIGAIPTISVRFQDSTRPSLRPLVHYANIGKGTILLSIGNNRTIELLDGKRIDPVYFATMAAIALRNEAVDPSIKRCRAFPWGRILQKRQYPPVPTPPHKNGGLDEDFLKTNGDLVEIVTSIAIDLLSQHPTQSRWITCGETLEWGPW